MGYRPYRLCGPSPPADDPAHVTRRHLQPEPDRLSRLTATGLHPDRIRFVDDLAGQVLQDGARSPAWRPVVRVAHLASSAWPAGREALVAGAGRAGSASMRPAPTRMRRTRSVGWAPSCSQCGHTVLLEDDLVFLLAGCVTAHDLDETAVAR